MDHGISGFGSATSVQGGQFYIRIAYVIDILTCFQYVWSGVSHDEQLLMGRTGSVVRSTDSIAVDDDAETYRLAFDPAVDGASLAVIAAVAGISGTDPLNLDSIYRTVDPDALDTLCSHPSEETRVSFRYADFHITVDSSGTVTCRRPREE